MASSAEEAARALREIAEINARAAGFQDYQAESGQMVLWGFAYIIGFALTGLFTDYILLVWTLIVIIALIAGSSIARRTNPDIPGIAWRYLALIGSILLLCVLINIVMWPLTPRQGAMLAPLFVATLYILRGVQLRPRYLVIGVLLAVLSMVGFLWLDAWFWWWMAFAFGGTLAISGLWLRNF